MKTKTELQKELAKKLREVTELETQIKEMPDEVVGCMPMTEKPNKGQVYYCIADDGVVYNLSCDNDEFDSDHFATGNCYDTKETAERALQRKKLKFREYQAAMASWDDEQIDFKNRKQQKWFAFYECEDDSVRIDWTCMAYFKDAMFKTEESVTDFSNSLTKDEQLLLWAGK